MTTLDSGSSDDEFTVGEFIDHVQRVGSVIHGGMLWSPEFEFDLGTWRAQL
jgi:hypothetical protein